MADENPFRPIEIIALIRSHGGAMSMLEIVEHFVDKYREYKMSESEVSAALLPLHNCGEIDLFTKEKTTLMRPVETQVFRLLKAEK